MTKADLDLESRRFGENHDCAVRAIAAVSGFSYADVRAYLASRGRRKGRGTANYLIAETLNLLEVKRTERPDLKAKGKTVRTLARVIPKTGKFLVNTRGHILAIVDGEVLDWTKGRLHRVESVLEVS